MLEATHVVTLVALAFPPGEGTHRPSPVLQFVGSTPCDESPRAFVGIPTTAPCERITWNLALADAPQPTFTLQAVYGMQARNEPGFAGGGSATTLNGTWTTVNGTGSDPAGVVYRLTARHRSLELRKLADNLLHLLDARGALMVGNGGWSYTLNRKNPVVRRSASAVFEPVAAPDAGAAGVFDGRSPCREIATQLGIRRGSDCTKLKWRLILHQDAATRAPTRYVLEGTLYRNAPRQGTWTVVRNTSDRARVVYRLHADGKDAFLSFSREDDNILLFLGEDGDLLVGDEYFSYTLNRLAR